MGLSSEIPLFISIRRSTPVQLVKSNGDKYVSIMTSEGTRELALPDYYKFVTKMSPNVVLAVPDLPTLVAFQRPAGSKESSECIVGEDLVNNVIPRPGGNRIKKMVFRTERWMENFFEYLSKENKETPAVFAPFLPYVDLRSQTLYLEYIQKLNENKKLAGLTFWSHFGNALERAKDEKEGTSYSEDALKELWNNVNKTIKERKLNDLIRYNNATMETPHDILDQVLQNGSDMFNGDIISQFTDAGVVLDFVFPVASSETEEKGEKAIGMNMWEDKYITDMSLLGEDTPNVTGTHNRAYIHHLLDAHEMTAWVLLQIHNSNVLRLFFEGIQRAVEAGNFEEEVSKFKAVYGEREDALLVKEIKNTSQKKHATKTRLPKARGYTVGYSELKDRTRGENEGQKLNEVRWSKDNESTTKSVK